MVAKQSSLDGTGAGGARLGQMGGNALFGAAAGQQG